MRRISGLLEWLLWPLLAYVLAEPFLFDQVRQFQVDPGEWVKYAGWAILFVYYVTRAAHNFLLPRLNNAAWLHLPALLIMAPTLIIGVPLALLGKTIHAHARFAIERPALERFVEGGGACPTSYCLTDPAGVQAFVWGSNNRAWTGVCHDPDGVMKAARAARREDQRAKRAPAPRVFGAVATRANRLSGDWYACGASRRQLGVPFVAGAPLDQDGQGAPR